MRLISRCLFCILILGLMCCNSGDTKFQSQIQNLNHPDSIKRGHAARVIGEGGSDAEFCVPHLRKLLKDESSFVRVRGAVAIWNLKKDQEMIKLLINELNGDGDLASREAIVALAAIGPVASASVGKLKNLYQRESLYGKIRIASALVSIDRKNMQFAFCVFRNGLRSSLPFDRLAAVEELSKLRDFPGQALPMLRGMLADDDENVREAALAAIKAIGAK